MDKQHFNNEVKNHFKIVQDTITMYCNSPDIATQAHEALMKLRELAVTSRSALEVSLTTKEIQRINTSFTSENLVLALEKFSQSFPVKILDADASTDFLYAVSKIDSVFVLESNPQRETDEQEELIIVLQKNMKVDWVPIPGR